MSIISKMIVPDVSLLDPLPLTTMDRDLTAHTGMDALAHAFEAYVSNANSPTTDLFSLEAIRLLAAGLVPVLENPENLELRAQTMHGSLYAGLAFTNASLGLLHAMGHTLGGFLDVRHGESNVLLFQKVTEYNFEAAPDRYARIAEALGLPLRDATGPEIKARLLETLEALRQTMQLGNSLGRLGVKRTDLPELAAKSLRDPCVATNPRKPTLAEIEALYEQAL